MDHSCPAPLQIGRRTVMRRPFSTLYVPPYFTLTDIFAVFRGIGRVCPWISPVSELRQGLAPYLNTARAQKFEKKIHKMQRVGLLVSSTTRPALFCCPANSNRAFSVRTLRSMAGYNGITGTAKKGTRSFARFAEYTAGWESGRGPQKQ